LGGLGGVFFLGGANQKEKSINEGGGPLLNKRKEKEREEKTLLEVMGAPFERKKRGEGGHSQ